MSKVQELRRLLDQFETCQEDLSWYGASDTEPDGLAQMLAWSAWKHPRAMSVQGNVLEICRSFELKWPWGEPKSDVSAWSLFKRPGAEHASWVLTAAITPIIELILAADKQDNELKELVWDWTWRVTRKTAESTAESIE